MSRLVKTPLPHARLSQLSSPGANEVAWCEVGVIRPAAAVLKRGCDDEDD